MSFAVFCVIADSAYYGTLNVTVDGEQFKGIGDVIWTIVNPLRMASFRAEGDCVITPWNNLMYNLNVDNLAQHGIHPRYTHIAINLPLLYGPLAIFGLLSAPRILAKVKDEANEDSKDLFFGKAVSFFFHEFLN